MSSISKNQSATAVDGDPVKGDQEREAIASLGGYAYQIAVAALGWLDLQGDDRLHLEVAEDFATASVSALTAVQVKRTGTNITLNTQGVRDAIDAYVDLVERNPSRNVDLHYLTTSSVSKESDWGGESGLELWRAAARSGDLTKLRAYLTGAKVSQRVKDFCAARDDNSLRADILKRIHWLTNNPNLEAVLKEFRERIIVVAHDEVGLSPFRAEGLANNLLSHVLLKSVEPDRTKRVLTRADLISLISAEARVNVPRETAEMMNALIAGLDSSVSPFNVQSTSGWVISGTSLPTPRQLISRPSVEKRMVETIRSTQTVFAVGGTGLGKSLTSRRVAAMSNRPYLLLDFRDVDASEAGKRLDLALGQLGRADAETVILEDLDEFDSPTLALRLGRVISALGRRDRQAIITCHRAPSMRVLTELGLGQESIIEFPYFTEEESIEVVKVAGGDPSKWGKLAHAAGGFGHPQLVHAFAQGMAARKWPEGEIKGIVSKGLSSADIEAARDAALRELQSALPENVRNLLYRLSIVGGRFKRALALELALEPPVIDQAGECFTELVGPWIEELGEDEFRVSPLVAHAGVKHLASDALRALHNRIADELVSHQPIKAFDANTIFMHALLGRNTDVLFKLSYAAITADAEKLPLLADQFFVLKSLRTEQPIYESDKRVSSFLRLAQFRFVSTTRDSQELSKIVLALRYELAQQPDDKIRSLQELISLGMILITLGIAAVLDDWFQVLRRFSELMESTGFSKNLQKQDFHAGHSYRSMMFAVGTAKLGSTSVLEKLFQELDALPKEEREMWLQEIESGPNGLGLFIHGPWASELAAPPGVGEWSPDPSKIQEISDCYARLEKLAEKWGNRSFAIECACARSVLLDEYSKDTSASLKVITDAERKFGNESRLERQKAKVYGRGKDFAKALEIYKANIDTFGVNSSIDRAYVLRDAAISAAEMNDWPLAEKWFHEGALAARTLPTETMDAMSVGLVADSAYAAIKQKEFSRSLSTFADVLDRLKNIDPDTPLQAAHCHRAVGHLILWAYTVLLNEKATSGTETGQVFPGMCSNPTPLEAIKDHRLGPIDYCWYRLAEAEVMVGSNVGISGSFRAKLSGEKIYICEYMLLKTILKKAVISFDSRSFANNLLKIFEAVYFFQDNPDLLKKSDVYNPPRGSFPPLNRELLDDRPELTDIARAVFGFSFYAALGGRFDVIESLATHLFDVYGGDYPGKNLLDYFRDKSGTLDSNSQALADIFILLRDAKTLSPEEIWTIGFRIYEMALKSILKDEILSALSIWLGQNWRQIVDHQAFRLKQPSMTVPSILAVLGKEQPDINWIAELLTEASHAINLRISHAAREVLLTNIARSGVPPVKIP